MVGASSGGVALTSDLINLRREQRQIVGATPVLRPQVACTTAQPILTAKDITRFVSGWLVSGETCSLQGFCSHGEGIPRQGRLEGCHKVSAATHLICGLEGVR